MVHKKYIKRGKKVFGPYYYENYRENGVTKTRYLGTTLKKEKTKRKTSKKNSWTKKLFPFIGIVVLVSLLFFSYSFFSGLTGRATLNVASSYYSGENIDGNLDLVLKYGELIPSSSKIVIDNSGEISEYLLSDLLLKETLEGNFYAENSELTGAGDGFGFIGTKEIYPTIYFTLKVKKIKKDKGGESETQTPEEPEESETNETEIPETNETETEEPEVETNETEVEEPEETETEEETEEEVEEESEDEEETETESEEDEEEDEVEEEDEEDEDEESELAPITGEAIKENKIKGEVSKNNLFSHELPTGKTAKIQKNSVKIDGFNKKGEHKRIKIGDDKINLEVSDGIAEVTTDYYKVEQGFGEEFLMEDKINFAIDLSQLGLVANQGTFTIKLVYGDLELASASKEIFVEGEEPPVTNETETPEEPSQNITEPPVTNETEIPSNVTEPTNETIVPETNWSGLINETLSTRQYKAIIGRPVKWIKSVKIKNNSAVIHLPKAAQNISIMTDKEVLDALNEIDEYENLIENSDREEIVGGGITGQVSLDIKEDKGIITRFLEWISSLFMTGNVIYEEEIGENIVETENEKVIEINNVLNISGEIDIGVEYYTDAPSLVEENIPNGKRVTINGDDEFNYEEILSYSLIDNQISMDDINQIKLYWITGGGQQEFTPYDLNGDNYVDYIEWIVPHLSEQVYEITLEILNVHSNPDWGGNWTVEFNTIGVANLTITATNEENYTSEYTRWTDSENSGPYDLEFLEIKCGNETLNYEWQGENCLENECSVFIEDYSCNETSYEISKVISHEKHVLKFEFGDKVAYAYNDITPWIWLKGNNNLNEDGTSSLTFSCGGAGCSYSATAKEGSHSIDLSNDHLVASASTGCSDDMTVAMWIYPYRVSGTTNDLFSQRTAGANKGIMWYLHKNNGGAASFDIYTTNYNGGATTTNVSGISGWTHVAISIDNDDFVRQYINGTLDPGGSDESPTIDDGEYTDNIRFGLRNGASSDDYGGLMDDIRVYCFALSSHQVRSLYNGSGVFGANGDSCTNGDECSSDLCINAVCRASGSCSSYEGYGCSSDGTAWNNAGAGTCLTSGTCQTSGDVATDCGTSCSLGSGENVYTTCSGRGGDACDTDAGGNFAQEGLCFDSGAGTDCETDAWGIFYDGTNYEDDSQAGASDYDWDVDSDGKNCDPTLTGGDYSTPAYMVTQSGCNNGIIRVDASNNNYFTSGCDSSGDMCDTGPTAHLTSPWVQNGICSDNGCDGTDVANSSGVFSACDGDVDGLMCESAPTSGTFAQDSLCLSDSDDGGSWDCKTSGHACFDGTYYEDTCASCAAANNCTSTLNSGDYSASGICLSDNSCDETSEAAKDCSYAEADCANYYSSCGAVNDNDRCDTDITGGAYSENGVCSSGSCVATTSESSGDGNCADGIDNDGDGTCDNGGCTGVAAAEADCGITVTIAYPSNATSTTETGLNVNYSLGGASADTCLWTNDTGANNNTITCGTNITSTTWTEKTHEVIVWANSSSDDWASASVTFTIAINLIVNITYPLNATNFSSPDVNVNVTATDDNLQTCWYSNDTGATNNTFTCVSNLTNINWEEGLNVVYVYANDSAGNANESEHVAFTVDTVAPLFANFTANVSNGTAYSLGTVYEFNVTATASNGTAILTFNNTNYTATNRTLSANVMAYFATPGKLPAGNYTYNWSSYGNGSIENFNYSTLQGYTIDVGTPVVNLTLNATESNITIYRGDVLWLNGTVLTGEGNLSLYVNNNLTNSSLSTVNKYYNFTDSGNLNITIIHGTTANYSLGSETYYVNVTNDTVYALIYNITDNSGTLTDSGTATFNATLVNANGTAGITFNGVNYSASNISTGSYNVSISVASAGTYSYTWWAYSNGTWKVFNDSSSQSYTVNSGASPTGGGSGSTGGGGGGGAPAPALEVDTSQVAFNLYETVGIPDYGKIVLRSTSNKAIPITAEIIGLEEILELDETSFTLLAGETKEIGFNIAALSEPGIYTGKVIFKSGAKKLQIPFALNVQSEKSLFDVSIDVPVELKNIKVGEKLNSQITLLQAGSQEKIDVTVNYVIKDFEGRAYLKHSETFAVQGQKSYEHEFNTEELPEGEYVVGIEVIYIGGIATASSQFRIGEAKGFDFLSTSVLGIVIFVFIALVLLIIKYKKGVHK